MIDSAFRKNISFLCNSDKENMCLRDGRGRDTFEIGVKETETQNSADDIHFGALACVH